MTVDPATTATEHRTFCRFCIAYCGALVTVEGGRVTKVRGDDQHPNSRGYLCPKGRALGINHHDARRLSHPLIGRGPDRREADWDEVLDDAAVALEQIVEESGPSSVAFLTGNGGSFDAAGRWALERLQRAMRSRTRYTNMTVDTPSKPVIGSLMAGSPVLVPAVDHERATMIVFVGCNPVVSHGHMNSFPDPVRRLKTLAERGEVWVVDPRRSETAELATAHLAPRPDTDWALLACVVREILRDGIDHEYVADHTVGLDDLTAGVEPFTVSRASSTTGLAAEQIEAFVDAIRRHRRVAIQTGTGVTFSSRATVVEWLVWALSIVTGSYDQPGGMWFHPGFFKQLDRRDLPEVDSPYDAAPGPASRPDLHSIMGEMPGAAFADEVEAGHIRAAVLAGLNPITAYPDAHRQRAALDQLDALVVADVMASGLTDAATHVLPVAGQLERADLSYWADYLTINVAGEYTPATLQPEHKRRPQWRALAQLGTRLGLDIIGEGVDADEIDEDSIITKMAKHSRRTADELRQASTAVVADQSVFGWVHHQILPGGRWRLAPARLLTALAELSDAPAAGGLDPTGFHLLSARQARHVNAQLAGVPLGGGHHDRPVLAINPDDARRLHLGDGDRVVVSSTGGSLRTHVDITDSLPPGSVALSQGYEDVNVTALVDDRDIDPHSSIARQTALRVTVTRVSSGEDDQER